MINEPIPLLLKAVDKPFENAAILYFEDTTRTIQDFYPGQFLTFLIEADGKQHRRSYSVCSSPKELPLIAVGVKRVENGIVSNLLNDSAIPGTTLKAIPPYGNFTLDYHLEELPNLALFAAGSGITPMMSIIKAALAGPKPPKISLFYGNRHQATIMFDQELNQLQLDYPNHLKVIHIISNPEQDCNYPKGKLTREMVQTLVRYEDLLKDNSCNYYVCGPEGMMHNVLAALEDLAVPTDLIHKESFYVSSPPRDSAKPLDEQTAPSNLPKTVVIKFKGIEYPVRVNQGENILQKALDAGLDLPYACQMGICGMCRAFKVQGEMQIEEQEALSESEIQEGHCLTCVGHPLSHDLMIDYDR